MEKSEYRSRIRDIENPYGAWIRDKEIKRSEGELTLPKEYSLFLNGNGDIAPSLASALSEYGAFTDGYDFIYADEDECDKNGKRHDPFFKPDYSPDTLESFYYPGGFSIVSNKLVEEALKNSGLKYGTLEFLRECALISKKPLHIPEVLYHAAKHHEYAYRDSADREEDFDFDGKVAIVILSKDHPELLKNCVSGVLTVAQREKVSVECIVIDNGSNEENTAEYERLSEKFGFKYFREEEEFVYSRLCNKGAKKTDAGLLLFLNDDIEVSTDMPFIKRMIREAVRERTGAVGCKLLYPGIKKIQHCGISLLKSGASHCFNGYGDSECYYRGINRKKRNVLAVTGACLMVERRKFEEAGGFDERLAIAYTDVELCAALFSKGYYNVCLNDFYLIHHESLSRMSDSGDLDKYLRLKLERSYFYDKFYSLIKNGDPFYNRNLTDMELDYSVNIDNANGGIPFYDSLTEASLKESGDDIVISAADEALALKKNKEEGFLLYSIDVCSERMSDENGNEDFVEISGWGFIHGKPGYACDIALFVRDGEQGYLLNTGHALRKDIISVFPKERDIALSGFSVKAKRGLFQEKVTEDKISVIFKTKDIFGRDRGYMAL